MQRFVILYIIERKRTCRGVWSRLSSSVPCEIYSLSDLMKIQFAMIRIERKTGCCETFFPNPHDTSTTHEIARMGSFRFTLSPVPRSNQSAISMSAMCRFIDRHVPTTLCFIARGTFRWVDSRARSIESRSGAARP